MGNSSTLDTKLSHTISVSTKIRLEPKPIGLFYRLNDLKIVDSTYNHMYGLTIINKAVDIYCEYAKKNL